MRMHVTNVEEVNVSYCWGHGLVVRHWTWNCWVSGLNPSTGCALWVFGYDILPALPLFTQEKWGPCWIVHYFWSTTLVTPLDCYTVWGVEIVQKLEQVQQP